MLFGKKKSPLNLNTWPEMNFFFKFRENELLQTERTYGSNQE